MSGETQRTSRVLIVEDNPGDAKLIRHQFEREAFTGVVEDTDLTHAESLTGAFEELAGGQYDIVFLDLGLPESTGLETLERFVEREPTVPVVVLTGLDDHELAIDAIQAGAQDYLVKGEIDGRTLSRSLRYAIERKKQEEELRRQTEQMDFFNSLLRHDMLNDMQVIRSRGALLAESLDGEDGEYAETIVEWSDDVIELTRKVRSVLDTLLDEEQSTLQPVAVDRVVAEEAERVRSMADGVSIDVAIPRGTVVRADDLLADVVGNLLTNAVDHSDVENPSIEVTTTEEGGLVTLTVADDGPGIPDAERSRVTERGETGAESGGTGFGLYFVAAMVDAYDGEMAIEDNDPRGTAVTLELPAV